MTLSADLGRPSRECPAKNASTYGTSGKIISLLAVGGHQGTVATRIIIIA